MASDPDAHQIDGRTSVSDVRFEYGTSVIGIGTSAPRLSWRVHTDDPSWSQTAYEIELNGDETVRVESNDQIFVPWPFEPIKSRGRASVRIRVASGTHWSEWSNPATAETGLLSSSDWYARFISPSTIGGIEQPAPLLSGHRTFRLGIASARLYITAHGIYEAKLNGCRVGNDLMQPGWTSYTRRLCYQTYDVTSALCSGENTLEVLLGNGRYRGRIGRHRAVYGDRLSLLAQLEVLYNDGSIDYLYTDENWCARDSTVLENDYYDGQVTDLRQRNSVTDTVDVLDEDMTVLTVSDAPPMRVTETISAISTWRTSSGNTLVDFGQNLVGWVRLRAKATTNGQVVRVRHAEMLENGELCVRALLGAKATDSYLLNNEDDAYLEPSLTFHGFRYAEVVGLDDVQAHDVQAVVVNADMPRIGTFTCSGPTLQRFHENVLWSIRGNMLDVPTDCPQRAERLGWTGDIQAITPTASFLFDTAGFFRSWLTDLALEQQNDGSVPCVIPTPNEEEKRAGQWTAAGWADAAVTVPWDLFFHFGDCEVLERQFPSMKKWVDKLYSLTFNGVRVDGFQFGDLMCPTTRHDSTFFMEKNDRMVIATAYLIRGSGILAETAKMLGYGRESTYYSQLASEIRAAFNREYVESSGKLFGDSPTAYALSIGWGLLLTCSSVEKAGERLVELVKDNDFRACTGFIGTPVIADALCIAGFPNVALEMLFACDCPSWLYPVSKGATTTWETWDVILPDGSINGFPIERDGQSVGIAAASLNHYALGSVR